LSKVVRDIYVGVNASIQKERPIFVDLSQYGHVLQYQVINQKGATFRVNDVFICTTTRPLVIRPIGCLKNITGLKLDNGDPLAPDWDATIIVSILEDEMQGMNNEKSKPNC